MDDYESITLTAVRKAFAGDVEALWIARVLLGHLGAMAQPAPACVDRPRAKCLGS